MAATNLAESPRVAIALGDPAGIGPEIALKAARDERVLAMCTPILFGDPVVLATHAVACGITTPIDAYPSVAAIPPRPLPRDRVALVARHQFADAPFVLGKVSAAHGLAALDSARAAIEAALAGAVAAVVAAPQTETAIKAAGVAFDGYPSFVARCTGTPVEDAFLMLCFDDKRIVHATLHVSLRRAIELVTPERVERVVRATDRTLRTIGVAAPTIAVAGLNPHAGEEGMFGEEEHAVIAPALARCRAEGIRVEGPFGCDTMFHRTGVDAFVVMFHDQGHIAAKLLARNRTAGLTIGTPILFSSVAHGSALDIAGRNQASPEAIVEAIGRLVGSP